MRRNQPKKRPRATLWRVCALTERLRGATKVVEGCPYQDHHPSCDCGGAGGDR